MNLTTKIRLATLGVAMGVASSVFAYTPPTTYQFNTAASPDNSTVSPFYVGFDLGFGGMNVNDGSGWFSIADYHRNGYAVTDSTKDTGNFVYRVYGGYLFPMSPKFAFGPEIGYTSYNNSTFNLKGTSTVGGFPVSETDTYSGHAVEFLGNATYFFGTSAYFFAKLGFAYVSQSLTYDASSQAPTATSSSSNTQSQIMPDLHLGIGWQLAPHFGFELSGFGFLGGGQADPTTSRVADSRSNKVASVWGILFGFRIPI